MTRYEKMCTPDGMAKIIYELGDEYNGDVACTESPLRVDGECPVDEEDICEETCMKCMKAWLMEEDDEWKD